MQMIFWCSTHVPLADWGSQLGIPMRVAGTSAARGFLNVLEHFEHKEDTQRSFLCRDHTHRIFGFDPPSGPLFRSLPFSRHASELKRINSKGITTKVIDQRDHPFFSSITTKDPLHLPTLGDRINWDPP